MGSHSFTCHLHWTIPAFTPQPQGVTSLWLFLKGEYVRIPRWQGLTVSITVGVCHMPVRTGLLLVPSSHSKQRTDCDKSVISRAVHLSAILRCWATFSAGRVANLTDYSRFVFRIDSNQIMPRFCYFFRIRSSIWYGHCQAHYICYLTEILPPPPPLLLLLHLCSANMSRKTRIWAQWWR